MSTTGQSAGSPRRLAGAAVVGVLAVVLVGAVVALVRAFGTEVTNVKNKTTMTVGVSGGVEGVLKDANALIIQGDYARAEALLAKAIEGAPSDQALRLEMMKALQGQKKNEEAYAQIQAALRIGPELPQLHLQAGTLASQNGKFDRAVEHYSLAQKLDTSDPQYPLFLAMAQIKAGDETGATASLLRVIKLDPSITEAWGTLAELELKNNSNLLAAQHAEKARALQPEVVRWRLVEARALKRQGKAEDAAVLLTALSPAQKKEPQVAEVLAECRGLMNKQTDAEPVKPEGR